MRERYRFKSKQSLKKQKIMLRNVAQNEKNLILTPHIELFSDREITVEGCLGVFEYREDYIKLKLPKGSLTLCGEELSVICFENKTISIGGKLSSLEFCIG